jgi:hypothetical protein
MKMKAEQSKIQVRVSAISGFNRTIYGGLFTIVLLLLNTGLLKAQNELQDINYGVKSDFEPTIKDAIKFADLPEIKDSVNRIENIKYGINSKVFTPQYHVQPIEAAKLQNEPLNRLYHSLLKLGYGPVYNMPFAEFSAAGVRSRESSYGAHLKHFSSTTHLKNVGYGGFSDNLAELYGKKFYKKHTLSGDLNYERNVVHYYGYDTSLNRLNDKNFTKQRYQLIEPKLRLLSHYTDSNQINHDIRLGFYNLQNLHGEAENNIRAHAHGSMFLNKEKLNIDVLTDFYNHKQRNDSLNDLIVSLSPYFEASGKKWKADVGLTGTIDNFKNSTGFYFYPRLNLNYNVYEDILIPYAGVNGGLIKNGMRSLSGQNPFVDTTIRYVNTDNKYNLFGGIRGNLSSNTSFDTRVSYSRFDSLNFFVMDYSGPGMIYNRFNVIYDNATLLTVSGELKYQFREKLNLIAKGNYYLYKTKNLTRPYHKPELDFTFSGIYNLQSKILVRADLFIMGNQWALTQTVKDGVPNLNPKLLKGWADMNLECEYRYSKMMSFFARINNIGNQRYFRWERYPSQRFNFMLGLTFVPF